MPAAIKCTPCAGRGATLESRRCPRCAHVRGLGARSCTYCQGTMQKTTSRVCWKCNGRGTIPRPTMAWSGLGRNGRAPIEPERKHLGSHLQASSAQSTREPQRSLRGHGKTPSTDSTQESQQPVRGHGKMPSMDSADWPLGDGAPF